MAKMSQTVGIAVSPLFFLTLARYLLRQLYKDIHSVRFLAIAVKFCCALSAWVLMTAEKFTLLMSTILLQS
jgi:hypothetical protein